MPQAVDLVINNGASTPVAKTFKLYAPAAGDNSQAQWRLQEGLVATVFPRLSILTRSTGQQARKTVVKFRLPATYQDAATGLVKVDTAFDAELNVTVPDGFPESLKNDAVAYLANVINHPLVKAVLRDAIPAS